MKKLHLVCNSHIDPVWMWDWEEGIGTAISTFWQAVRFCEEYDYIFCHNEAFLYEEIERRDPALFEEIKKQIARGKWVVMGGWYIQPDCNLPSGEAFVRQIKLGRKYFSEKLGAYPTTAINFDSFGHTVGLVQILKKCGFDSYLCCRPMPELLKLPANEIWWVGPDGSRVKATRTPGDGLYCTGFGKALEEIKKKNAQNGDVDTGIVLWGVGNHGGNPSRKDLCDVNAYIKEESFEVVHSTPERYFAELTPKHEWHRSLHPCLVGAYTSMSRIKRKHIELENALTLTEKICTLAELRGVYQRNGEKFTFAEKALALIEFHDVGSGTCTAEGEKSSLRKADAALEHLKEEYDNALFALISRERRAGEGEYPHFVFNPFPNEREAVVEFEYLSTRALIGGEKQNKVSARVNGEVVPSQCIKELSNINYDRRKRIAVKCTLAPFDITRIDITEEVMPAEPPIENTGDDILFSDSVKSLRISRKTGLIESLVINGKEQLTGGAFQLLSGEDNADPWGWYMDVIGKNPTPFKLSACDKGPFKGYSPVKIVEKGDVLTEVEAFFEYGASFARTSYKIYRDTPYVDVSIDLLYNEKERAIKLKVPTAPKGDFFGQVPFGIEKFEKNGYEMTMQRFAAVEDGESALAIFNDCTFGHSHDGEAYYATLLRGAAYCAHPLDEVPLLRDPSRYLPYIEQGKHTFRFRIAYDKKDTLETGAQSFVHSSVEALNFFPHGEGYERTPVLEIADKTISLVSTCLEKGALELRFVNNCEQNKETTLKISEKEFTISFGKYEAKTYVFDGDNLTEKKVWF